MGISLYRNGVKVQKKRAADSTTARLINYVLYLRPTEWLVKQKMAGSLPAAPSPGFSEARPAGRHATIIRSTSPCFIYFSSYSLLPALNINSSF
jgi:hypothetical protein